MDTEHTVALSLICDDGAPRLETDLYAYLQTQCKTVSTETLGMAFEPEQRFETPDGEEIVFNQDYFGDHRSVAPVCGPFEGKEQSGRPLF